MASSAQSTKDQVNHGAKAMIRVAIAGGCVMGLALGMRHATGLFLIPITMAHHWSRQDFTLAIAIQNLVWGIAQPFTGAIADRFGSMKVMMIGLACYVCGLTLMGMVSSLGGFIVSGGFLIGLALSGTTFGVIYGALSRMGSASQRPLLLSLAGAMGGFGQFAMVPVLQHIVMSFGWVIALWIVAALMVLAMPCTILFKRSDAPVSFSEVTSERIASPKEAAAEALKHRGFWLLALGFGACGLQLAFMASHLPSYLIDQHFPLEVPALGLGIIALSNVFGTYTCGLLSAHYSAKKLLSVIYLLRAMSTFTLISLPLTRLGFYGYCAVVGFIWLGTVPLTSAVISKIFGPRYVSTIFGIAFFFHQLGSFFGVWGGGLIYDMTHSYTFAWQIIVGIGILASLMHFLLDDRPLSKM